MSKESNAPKPKPKGKTLKKGPIIGIIVALLGCVMIAITLAMAPAEAPNEMDALTKTNNEETVPNGVTPPKIITNAPDNSAPVTVAKTSEETTRQSGNRGAAKTGTTQNSNSKRSSQKQSSTNGNGITEEQLREEQRALTSGLFFSDAGGMKNDFSSKPQPRRKSTEALYQEEINRLGLANGDQGSGQGLEGLLGGGDPNLQGRKNEFVKTGSQNYLKSGITSPLSPYEIKSGSILPVSLITGINSDLPGDIIGQMRENVYDTVTGNHLLIPQGSKVLAKYDSMVAYGQNRVLVCWHRLIRPDGTSLDLECAPGVDSEGYAGFSDTVDNHFGRVLGGVLVSAVLSATATKSQGGGSDMNFDQLFASNVGQHINNAGQKITEKNISIQPTIKVRPGFSVNVLVNKDMIIPPYVK